jgi:hypothetical protein
LILKKDGGRKSVKISINFSKLTSSCLRKQSLAVIESEIGLWKSWGSSGDFVKNRF